jgi:transposase
MTMKPVDRSNFIQDIKFRRLSDRAGIGHQLDEAFWSVFRPYLTEKQDGRGRPAFDKRKTLEGILWVATTRRNWRELPLRYGQWNSIYRQFSRWSMAGTWEYMRQQTENDTDMARLLDELIYLWGRVKFRHHDKMRARTDYSMNTFK